MTDQVNALIPEFPFAMPVGYRWLVQQGLVGYVPDSALQPWYFLPKADAFSAVDRWPGVNPHAELYVFARRQDCDDLACFATPKGGGQPGVVVVHGWTPEGYEVVATYGSIWEWLRSVISDLEEWAETGANLGP
jgi:hypothetical protein